MDNHLHQSVASEACSYNSVNNTIQHDPSTITTSDLFTLNVPEIEAILYYEAWTEFDGDFSTRCQSGTADANDFGLQEAGLLGSHAELPTTSQHVFGLHLPGLLEGCTASLDSNQQVSAPSMACANALELMQPQSPQGCTASLDSSQQVSASSMACANTLELMQPQSSQRCAASPELQQGRADDTVTAVAPVVATDCGDVSARKANGLELATGLNTTNNAPARNETTVEFTGEQDGMPVPILPTRQEHTFVSTGPQTGRGTARSDEPAYISSSALMAPLTACAQQVLASPSMHNQDGAPFQDLLGDTCTDNAPRAEHDSISDTEMIENHGTDRDISMERLTPRRCDSRESSPDCQRHSTPIITDANRSEVIIIDDDLSGSVHNRHRVRFRPHREGMVAWSDAKYEQGRSERSEALWIAVQYSWMSLRELLELQECRNVKGFDKVMNQVEVNTRCNGVMDLKDADKLQRTFGRVATRISKRVRRESKKVILQKYERLVKELYEEVELLDLIRDHPMDDGDEKDEDYTPKVK